MFKTFDTSGAASFEIRVYNKGGTEVGVLGSEGWIAKHGLAGSPEIPDEVYRVIKGFAIDTGRGTGQFGKKGTQNIKNWLWNGKMGAIEHGGKAASLILGAVAINTALTSSHHAAETARSYARNVESGESAFADLDAIEIAIDIQEATGNYFMSYEALDILLQ